MMAVVLVSAINAKTVEVTFNKAVDTEKATVELLKGTFKQNVTVTWAEDMMSVQLVGANNFQAGDYTVKVSGLTEEALTEDFKIEAQKVAEIEILDDVAVLDAALVDGDIKTGTKATVSYIVKDQYGTDITKTTELTTNDTKIVAKKADGVVEISGNLVVGKKLGDLVPVVLIDSKTGISTSKTVALSATSTVSEMEVAGIYNAKGEEVTLNDKSKAADAYLVLNLKDQYGKEITNVDQAKGLVVTNTNNTILELKENDANKTVVESVKIDGKDKLVVKFASIKKAGNVDILFISTTNGKSVKYTVTVEETTTTDEISVSQPEIAVADEELLIPITVTDKAGNVITDKKLLANKDKGIKVGNDKVEETQLVVKDGQVYYKDTFSKGTKALVFQTSTFKVATITLDVKAKAVATVVRGLKDTLVISKAQAPVEVTAKDHLIIEDQYGRAMKDATNPVEVTKVGTSDVISVVGNEVKGLKNGTAKLKVKLVTENGDIDSAVEVTVRVTDGKEYTGYEIAPIGKVLVNTPKEFTVKGILNGGKVDLEASEYTAIVTGGKLEANSKTGFDEDGNIKIEKTDLNTKENVTPKEYLDTEFTLKVTINATGKVLEQKFVVSEDTAKTQEFFFTTDSVYKDAKAITNAVVKGGVYTINSKVAADKVLNVATIDQYGKKEIKALNATDAKLTITPEKAAEVNITFNGKKEAKAVLADGVTEAKLTVSVKIGNATKELTVVLNNDAVVINEVLNGGDVEIDTLAYGTINITGNATSLTVNAPNATVNNEATVSGTITITDVSTATWNQNANHAGEIVFDAEGKKLVVKETVTVAKLTVNAARTTVVNNGKIEEAVIEEDVALVGDTPVKVTGEGNVTGAILAAPENGAIKKDSLEGVTKDGAKFLVYGLNNESGQQEPSTLEEVKAHMLERYEVNFNTDAIKVTDGNIEITGSVLSTSDWNKVKANGDKAIPYRITLVKDNTTAGNATAENKVLKIAMYQDGKAILNTFSNEVIEKTE